MTRVRLRAKRRWGELLPEPEPGNPGGRSDDGTYVTNGHVGSDADRKSAERARKSAEVPAEAFEAALENSEPEKPPSEASLLRMETPQLFNRETVRMPLVPQADVPAARNAPMQEVVALDFFGSFFTGEKEAHHAVKARRRAP